MIFQAVHDISGRFSCGGVIPTGQIHAQEQTDSANITDDRVTCFQALKAA